jgi:hypothetical protein
VAEIVPDLTQFDQKLALFGPFLDEFSGIQYQVEALQHFFSSLLNNVLGPERSPSLDCALSQRCREPAGHACRSSNFSKGCGGYMNQLSNLMSIRVAPTDGQLQKQSNPDDDRLLVRSDLWDRRC